jgi:hypothetical protein
MFRLLWKELHEAKWYLLSLLAVPWIVSLWCIAQKGIRPSEIYALCFWVCTLPIAFLASTRVQKDMQPNQLSADWLPVNRWVDFLVKFAPGIIVVVLVPTWLRFVVTVCAGDPGVLDHLMTAVASSIYTFTFAVSMFLPSLPAALVGVAVDMVACGWSIKALPSYVPREIVTGALAAIAVTACIGVWARTERSSIKTRASGAVTGIAVGLVPVVVIGFLVSMHAAGGLQEFRTLRTEYLAQRKSEKHHRNSRRYPSPFTQVSMDGRSIAFVTNVPGSRDGSTRLVIADIGGGRTIVPGSTASPAAWLRNGDLLVFTGTSASGIQLSRFDRHAKRLVWLASFPPCRGDQSLMRPIISVAPDSSSNNVALVVMPPNFGLPDLWVVDARTRSLKLVRRSFSTEQSGDYLAWNDGSIVIVRGSDYCRMPLDGSRPVWITDAQKEVRHD